MPPGPRRAPPRRGFQARRETRDRAWSLAETNDLALRYLNRRMRSHYELSSYLSRRGVPEPLVLDTINEMSRLGYLDDSAYARAFALDRVRLKPRGYRLIDAELRQRGVDRNVIGDVLADVETEVAEVDVAMAFLRGRARRLESLSEEERSQTVRGWLLRKGFRGDTVREAIDTLLATERE